MRLFPPATSVPPDREQVLHDALLKFTFTKDSLGRFPSPGLHRDLVPSLPPSSSRVCLAALELGGLTGGSTLSRGMSATHVSSQRRAVVSGSTGFPRARLSDQQNDTVSKAFLPAAPSWGKHVPSAPPATCFLFLYFTIQCVKDRKCRTETWGEAVGAVSSLRQLPLPRWRNQCGTPCPRSSKKAAVCLI